MKRLILCAALLGASTQVPQYSPGPPPKDSHGIPATWCSAYIVTDYGRSPPKEIVARPAGWCFLNPNPLQPTPG